MLVAFVIAPSLSVFVWCLVIFYNSLNGEACSFFKGVIHFFSGITIETCLDCNMQKQKQHETLVFLSFWNNKLRNWLDDSTNFWNI